MATKVWNSSWRERLNISRIAIQYRWLTLGFWIIVMVAGILAFSSLKYALFPDITFPVVIVNAEAPFTTATETEGKLTIPIEGTLQPLKQQGLDKIAASTFPGRTVVTLSFQVGTNLNQAKDAVSARLQPLQLTNGASYTVLPINLNEASVVSYGMTSTQRMLPQLVADAENVVLPAIARLPGILKVKLLGVPAGSAITNRVSPAAEIVISPPGTSAIRLDGQAALAFEVIKRSDANVLEVISQVEATVQQLQKQRPEVKLTLATTQADYIRDATQTTIDALVVAIGLSVIVIFPFLWSWQATLISALAIPTSLLGTFVVMAIFGFNLDTITLLALALVIGIIIDDAIVDVENISRHLEAGEPPRQAAINATNEIGLTVTAATFAIVAVFLPVGLMQNVLGQFFKPFGVTVSAAVIISLLVARTLSPLLAVYWLRPRPTHREHPIWSEVVQGYYALLKWSLYHRWVVVGVAFASFLAGIALIPQLPKGFIPKLDSGEFYINYTTPLPPISRNPENKGLAINPLDRSLEIATRLETAALKSPHLDRVFTTVGRREEEPNKGRLFLKFRPDRSQSTAELEAQTRAQLPSLPGVSTTISDIQFVETGDEKPLKIALKGDDSVALRQTAQVIQQRLQRLPGFVDVTISGEDTQAGEQNEIERLNSQRVTYVSANLAQGLVIGNATEQVVAIANQVKPANIRLDLGGDSARQDEIFGSFSTTLALSVLCILLVLLLLFRRWTDPLVIILSLPLSVLGALVASLLTGAEFSIISVIGIIFLLGLTSKNAILIVDYINQLRRSGMSRNAAILQAVPIRLRPILMTTLATILGMMPIALGIGTGSELRAPMAIAIIGGLVTSTLLSLLVVPVAYDLLDDVKIFKREKTVHE